MNKKVKKLKEKVKFLGYDIDSLNEIIQQIEQKKRSRKNIEMKVMRVVITATLISLSLTYFYTVFFK